MEALPEPEAASAELQDVTAMGQPIEQGSSEPLVAEDAGPVGKRQVGRDGHRPALVSLREELKQQLRSRGGEGHEAQLVDDHQVKALEGCQESGDSVLGVGLQQPVGELGGRGEAYPLALLAGCYSQGRGQVGVFVNPEWPSLITGNGPPW